MSSVKRILVVDDEAGFARLLKLGLERTGRYDVRVENRARGALESAREFEPHLILLDCLMPEMDGREVAVLMRADEKVKRTPIVFLTGLPGGSEDGPQPSLGKLSSLDEIVSSIERHLGAS